MDWDFVKFMSVFVVGITVFMGGILGLVNMGEEANCRNTAAVMGVEYHYSFTTPCMVKMDGKPWLPLSAIRAVN